MTPWFGDADTVPDARQAEALGAYRAARARIVEELGAEPGPELRRMHEAILHHDAAIAAPAAPAPRRASRRRGRLLLLAAVAGLAAIAAALVVAAGSGSEPAELRLAEDSVGLLDAGATRVRAVEPAGRDPEAIALGGGSIWVANALDGTVTLIYRAEDRSVTITVGAHPMALAYGAGSLWVVSGDDGAVAQVDPTSNRVAQRIAVGGGPPGSPWDRGRCGSHSLARTPSRASISPRAASPSTSRPAPVR
jgi:hypothetical protein